MDDSSFPAANDVPRSSNINLFPQWYIIGVFSKGMNRTALLQKNAWNAFAMSTLAKIVTLVKFNPLFVQILLPIFNKPFVVFTDNTRSHNQIVMELHGDHQDNNVGH